ncbi:MAG: SRPBCC family protein [Pigmentiphaga sp.]
MISPPAHGTYVDDRINDGHFSVRRSAMQDPALFDLEIQRIFESHWVFVGLASQLPAAHDYLSVMVGRTPVLLSRGGDGRIRGFIDSCRHRGARLTAQPMGNRRTHSCPYHGWVYDSQGRCLDIKDRQHGGYTPAFDAEDHNLVEVARLGDYRGFLFVSLAADVPSVEEFLGDTRDFLDLAIDQSPDGLECVPGDVSYTYRGNWKLQVENALDLYHFTSTHPSYIQVLGQRKQRRQEAGSGEQRPSSIYENMAAQRAAQRGTFSFRYGHVAYWGDNPNAAERPLARDYDALVNRVGAKKAEWMLKVRNLVIFPNLQLVENASLQLRILRPLRADLTEVRAYCLAPVGEDAATRRARIRQYEDFYNPSGLATPDDVAVYERCQQGTVARQIEWFQGYARGITARREGGNDAAAELGLHPVESVAGGYALADETCFHTIYREWQRLLGLPQDEPVAHGGPEHDPLGRAALPVPPTGEPTP